MCHHWLIYFYFIRWDLPKCPNRKWSATTPVLCSPGVSHQLPYSHRRTQFYFYFWKKNTLKWFLKIQDVNMHFFRHATQSVCPVFVFSVVTEKKRSLQHSSPHAITVVHQSLDRRWRQYWTGNESFFFGGVRPSCECCWCSSKVA